ncbi:MAG: O-antigen ligase family protein [Bacteroidetes bacterium]|nr:O-antigen ligase family protein [Bacteroidota bacterium]
MHWTQKWFPVFILLRPIADNFYFLKQISPFISPLYILGVLAPVLIFFSLRHHKMKSKSTTVADGFMRIWGIAVFINCLFLFIYQMDLEMLGSIIKYSTPPLLFLYARRFVHSKEDVVFLMQTFFYSCIFPFIILAFETFVHPIQPELISEGRGGGFRVHGTYSDCMNYAVYFIGAFLVYSYFFLDKVYANKSSGVKPPTFKMIGVFLICLGGIISIRHVSTWAVFIALIAWLFAFNARRLKGLIIALFLGLIIAPFFARSIYEKQIEPLLQKEISVVNGDAQVETSFNGRMSRWERYFEIWERMPVYAHFFGVSFTHFDEVPIMVGGGMHSDYVRVLFLTGMFGLLIYLVFIWSVLARRKNFRPPERYLIIASVTSIILYSVSTLPLNYIGYMQLMLPVFAFALLPKRKIYTAEFQPALNDQPA